MQIFPVILRDGTSFYTKLQSDYTKHNKGFFILAPSGVGKTHYCKNQVEKHWIDGDDLWITSGAHPDIAWWTMGEDVINHVDARSDIVTLEARMQGFWIMGASNQWLKPDAIVIPDWDTHTSYILSRETEGYDGGATSADHAQVKSHIEVIRKWHTDHGVPLYTSISGAVNALTKNVS